MKDLLNQAWLQEWIVAVNQAFKLEQTSELAESFAALDWAALSLKQRISKAARLSYGFLTQTGLDYADILSGLQTLAPQFRGLPGLVLPQIIEEYGLDEWDLYESSMQTLAVLTEYSTAEFAIRPFIERDPERTLAQMQVWSLAENHHLRRLSSEGCRPRLPWGRALKGFKQDPAPILPILQNLIHDPSLYVRKSVANNLNDIGKDHPEELLAFCQAWLGTSKEADWIIKHASRNFLKQGDSQFLALIGIRSTDVQIVNWWHTTEVKLGDALAYGFELVAAQATLGSLRVELQVEFPRAKGRLYQKVFKLIEGDYQEQQKRLAKTLPMKPLSTRKIYPGRHGLKLIINGEIKHQAWFEVVA